MERFINFIDILAWCLFVINFIMLAFRIHAMVTESEADRLIAAYHGVTITYPIKWNLVLVVVTFAWLYAPK